MAGLHAGKGARRGTAGKEHEGVRVRKQWSFINHGRSAKHCSKEREAEAHWGKGFGKDH